MKKLLYAALAALLLVGCGSSDDPNEGNGGNNEVPKQEVKQGLSDEELTKLLDQSKKLSTTLAEAVFMFDDYTEFKSMDDLEFDMMPYLFLVTTQYPDEASHIYHDVTIASEDGVVVSIHKSDAEKIANQILGSTKSLDALSGIYDDANECYSFNTQVGAPHRYDVLQAEAVADTDTVKATLKISELDRGQNPDEIESKRVFMKYKVMEEDGEKFLRLIEIGDVK